MEALGKMLSPGIHAKKLRQSMRNFDFDRGYTQMCVCRDGESDVLRAGKTLPGRLELPTSRLTASRSSQLSYGSPV